MDDTATGTAIRLHCDRVDGDPDHPTLLLLHGLGGTGAVFDRLAAASDWAGAVVSVDLRGHGASPWTARYSFGAMAADVCELLAPGERLAVIGHSMGAAVALALASGWYRVEVTALATIGIKVNWSDDELANIDRVAAKPPRELTTRDDAAEWALKLAGLYGIVDVDDPITDRAVRRRGDAWIASLDPAAGTVGPPLLESMHAALDVPVLHTCGGDDQMTSIAELAPHGPTHEFAGTGHNPMVEQPGDVWDRLGAHLRG